MGILGKKRKKKEKLSGEKPSYGLISNIIFLYKELFQQQKKAIIVLPIYIINQILLVIVVVLIPARAVYVIEQGLGIADFFLQIGSIFIFFGILLITQQICTHFYMGYVITCRRYGFVGKLVEKSLTTDYCNWESNKNQKQIGKANMAISGGTLGLEQIYRQLPNVIINFIGLILFGGAILTVDIRILLVLIVMFLCNFYLNQFARNYTNSVLEEDAEIQRKMGFIHKGVLDPIFGKDARIYRMEHWLCGLLSDYMEQGCAWQKRLEKRWYLPAMSDTIFIAIRDGLAYILLIHMAFQGKISLAELTMMLNVVSRFSDWMLEFVNACMEVRTADRLVLEFRKTLDIADSFHHYRTNEANKQKYSDRQKYSNRQQHLDIRNHSSRQQYSNRQQHLDIRNHSSRQQHSDKQNHSNKQQHSQSINTPEIEFRNVSFRYGEEEPEILSHINLHIRQGEKIALVGANGAGKTTLVKLLCGFYHPTEGEILVNHKSIEDYIIEDYFKMIGVVFQDMDMLAISIVSLVSGKEKKDTDMERFWNAVEQADIRKKIESLEKKEDTYFYTILDDHGIQFSGGETQKLMLARCIYKDAPLLILDEPTSALDPIAESRMYETYDHLTKKKTSIFISHRLASTKFCDRILFLENGTIIEQGSHEELLYKKGRYAKIYEIQSHYYKGEEMNQAYER